MIMRMSRMYFRRNVVHIVGECEFCGGYGKQVSYQARKFGHLYFIPLIPMGASSQVLRECAACNMGAHLALTDLAPLLEVISNDFKTWILAIQGGETEFSPEPGQDPVNFGVLISGILEDLYCLKEIENIQSISTILRDNHLDYEDELVRGRWFQMNGDLPQAKGHYQEAHRLRPEEPIPLYQLGSTEVKMGDGNSAENSFAKYSRLHPEDISPYIELAGLYESKKDFPKIVSTYDQLYSMNEELIPEKGMRKVYKKACKKSGIEGKYLDKM